MDFKKALKDKAEKAKQEEAKKEKKIAEVVSEKVKKGGLLGLAQNPMVKMAKKLNWKIKLAIALVVLMILAGIGTTGYWVVIGIRQIPIEKSIAEHVFYGIGVVTLFSSIYGFFKIKKDMDDAEKVINVFENSIDNVRRGNTPDVKKAVSEMFNNSDTKKRTANYRIFIFIWEIVGLFISNIKIFSTIIATSFICSIFLIIAKKRTDKIICTAITGGLRIILLAYLLYNFYFCNSPI